MRTGLATPRTQGKDCLRYDIARRLGVVVCLLVLAWATPAVAQQSPAPATSPSTPAPAAADDVSELLALSTAHFEAGQRELREGHLEMAKAEFNRSLEVLLESRFGARTVPRIREHFDRLVERISAYELTALAQGDGFTEKKYEPATIDDLLTISTFEQPPASPATKQAVSE
jgi:membrane-bound lytic murein transglycosylase D